uniref:Tyrosine decarboxylase n=1 Tax=Tetranychus urticae TaxID=32264 RepID=T1KIS9_TETUR
MCYSRLFGDCHLFFRKANSSDQSPDLDETVPLKESSVGDNVNESCNNHKLAFKSTEYEKLMESPTKSRRDSSNNIHQPTTFASISSLVRDIFRNDLKYPAATTQSTKSNTPSPTLDIKLSSSSNPTKATTNNSNNSLTNHHPTCNCSTFNGNNNNVNRLKSNGDSLNNFNSKRINRIKIKDEKKLDTDDDDNNDTNYDHNQGVKSSHNHYDDHSIQANFTKCFYPDKKSTSEAPFCGMDSKEWRVRGKEMVDYIANYLETIDQRRVTPNVEPGYLKPQLPEEAPLKAEQWDTIMEDFNKLIMPGITHWQHPRFHAYFPAGNAYPSILADMLSDAISCIGFSWAASPSCTELETIMLDWMGRAIGLPDKFMCFAENSKGGGVIEGSASECILVTLLAARYEAVKQAKKQEPNAKDTDILGKLIAYCSKEAHSSVEKAAMIGFVKLRILDTDEKFRMRPDLLEKSIQEDKAQGFIPFWAAITLGSTSCCSVDPVDSVGMICQKEGVWLHVDAAYGGSSLICPEFQYLLKGIELASSFNMNPNKWMLINFDCSLLWVTDRFKLTQALVVDPLYLQHSYSDKAIDYRHWGIPLSRRFRSLKLWFVIRNYGIEGLQKYIRNHCRLAKKFENLMRQDERFEIMNEVIFGLVCFRLKGSDTLNKKLLSSINASGEMHMVPANLGNKYVIRFCVCSQHATEDDISAAYEIISQFSANLLAIIGSEESMAALQQQQAVIQGDLTGSQQQQFTKQESQKSSIEEKEGSIEIKGGLSIDKIETTPEEETKKETEDEMPDEVIVFDRKINTSLKYRRSFFVRMVSDPKLYNPKIVKALSCSSDQTDDKDTGILSPI